MDFENLWMPVLVVVVGYLLGVIIDNVTGISDMITGMTGTSKQNQ